MLWELRLILIDTGHTLGYVYKEIDIDFTRVGIYKSAKANVKSIFVPGSYSDIYILLYGTCYEYVLM